MAPTWMKILAASIVAVSIGLISWDICVRIVDSYNIDAIPIVRVNP